VFPFALLIVKWSVVGAVLFHIPEFVLSAFVSFNFKNLVKPIEL
jgi:hypothetical protein